MNATGSNQDLPPSSGCKREELLARLMTDLVDRLRHGEQPDIEAVAQAHPELIGDLRGLWAAAQIAHDCSRWSQVAGLHVATTDAPASPPVASLPTQPPRLLGDYELIEEIGRGGMGVVYRARQVSLGRVVALKLMLSGDLASAPDTARFRAESESAAQLEHPHIVPVYSVSEHEQRPLFAMKWVDGITLAHRLANGPIPAREAAEILAPICRAIHFAHGRGVLHRDLKPSNILLEIRERGASSAGAQARPTDPCYHPFVSDFGLSKRVDLQGTLTQSGTIIGTPSYMPPEQAAGERGHIGPWSDIYSLGAILYHMLTGRPPFLAATAVDTVLQVLEQDPAPPRVVNPQADRELELIALKCLQKPPELRYATAASLAEDLERYRSGDPISARSGRFTAVISRWFRETHHATVLENWGVLWMWHSLAIIVLCVATNWLQWQRIESRLPYIAIWTIGLWTWAGIFWWLRQRGGPVTFVERQIAHVWGASIAASVLLFVVEYLIGFPVLTLSPVLGLIAGIVFVIKAGILSGSFYLQAAAAFVTAGVMAMVPDFALTIYGFVSAVCFFVPGLKYHLQRTRKSSSSALPSRCTAE